MCVERKDRALNVREFREEDAVVASAILQSAREAANWSSKALVEFLRLPGAIALMSERRGKPSGFILGRVAADEAEILNLGVLEECRREGEGRALVVELRRRFAELGVSRVFLEVRESNRGAITFYERMGFRQLGRREDYYQEPREAALVYEKNENFTRVVPNSS